MIRNQDFTIAKGILHRLVRPEEFSPVSEQFSSEQEGQNPIVVALKILHKAVKEGSKAQREELFQCRHEIVALNDLLSRNQLGIELRDMQIALPQTPLDKMVEVASRIPRMIFMILVEIALLLGAGITFLYYFIARPQLDPVQPKQDKIPILLLHGSGSNESEWMIGRQFLKEDHYGSVFSLNYDGLCSNDPAKGIDDYAASRVREKILQIKKLTKQDQVIIIGHSMGGMIAGYYAEHFAAEDGVQVKHVISIGSPWQGSPIIDRFIAAEDAPKRYNQMSSGSQFRKDLVATALHSERTEIRNYYSISSDSDILVPSSFGNLTEDPRRQRVFSYMGHYGIAVFPSTWVQIRSWLDTIYARESATVGTTFPDFQEACT